MAAQLRNQSSFIAEAEVGASSISREEASSGTGWPGGVDGALHRTLAGHIQTGAAGLPSIGNMQRFLEAVTPIVDLQTVQASDLNLDSPDDSTEVPFFWLRDFWSSLEQWSCYGVGVPIQLENGEEVVQYYTPYLSGMQLFTRQDCDDEDRPGQSGEASRMESDWSDTDFRDSSSDSSDTSERLRERLFECAAAMVSASHHASLGKKDNLDGAMSTCSTDSDDSGSPLGQVMESLREDSSSPGLSWSSCVDCKGGELCFQYFEKNRPHMRLPICDQVQDLEKSFPSISSLRSLDLHPSSWISIAWYPLYMIPSSLSLKDMGASFLTFHGLSTQLPSPAETCPRCRDEFWAAPRIYPEQVVDNWEERLAAGCKALGVSQPSDIASHSLRPVPREVGRRTVLPPFGMSAYKVKGAMWSDFRRFDHLRDSAEAWVKQMGVVHPDYTFFSSTSFM